MSSEVHIKPRIIERNLTHFARRLRKVGIKVGTGHVMEMLHALDAVGMQRREDVRASLQAIAVYHPDQIEIFQVEFDAFWNDLLKAQPPLFDMRVLPEDDEN